jgi:ABC-type transport system involved in multi-copper enzyme maturation permease subunit
MWNKVRYILLTAQRDSLFFGLALSIIFSTYVAFFLGSTAVVEEGQTALVYSAGISRIVLVLGLVVFVCFHIRRSFENREIDLMIVHPISRTKFILSYIIGYGIIALFFVLFTALVLYGFATYSDAKPNIDGFMVWTSSVFLEAVIISAMAMTASLILRSTVLAVLLCLGFYVLARMVGFVLIIVTAPGNNEISYQSFGHISKFVPRLDFFGKSEWLLYGFQSYEEIGLFVAQAAIFITLLLALAIYDFKKKEF